jgi:hypothetical protein
MGKVELEVTRRDQACKSKAAIVPTTITSLCCPGRVTIGMLPDDILLTIFSFCEEDHLDLLPNFFPKQPAWHMLGANMPKMAKPRTCITNPSQSVPYLQWEDPCEGCVAYLATLAYPSTVASSQWCG